MNNKILDVEIKRVQKIEDGKIVDDYLQVELYRIEKEDGKNDRRWYDTSVYIGTDNALEFGELINKKIKEKLK